MKRPPMMTSMLHGEINPTQVFSMWIQGYWLTDEELKELEEWARRVKQEEHIWIKHYCVERKVILYKNIKKWDAIKKIYI